MTDEDTYVLRVITRDGGREVEVCEGLTTAIDAVRRQLTSGVEHVLIERYDTTQNRGVTSSNAQSMQNPYHRALAERVVAADQALDDGDIGTYEVGESEEP